jgi:purine-binding chemotaxis protein CheW
MSKQNAAVDVQTWPEQRNLVTFRLNQQPYALPVEPIVYIIPMVTITPVPKINDLVEGVINVRGETVPVVNMRRHLGLPQTALQLHTPIVLVHVGEHTFGLIVDEVLNVLNLPPDRFVRPADVLPPELHDAPILHGLAHVPEGMILMLDPDHLFTPDQAQVIVQAMEFLDQLDAKAVAGASEKNQPTGTTIEEMAEGAQRDQPAQKNQK